MKDQFFITLPSNSSFTFFPENTTACYTTQLSQRISLNGSWEVALVEFHCPLTIKNVSNSNNIVYFVKDGIYIQKYHITNGYTSVSDILNLINTIPDVAKYIQLEMVSHKKIKVIKVTEDTSRIDAITLHPNLAFQLGFDPDTNLFDLSTAPRKANVDLGIANQIYVYCDLVEPQLVGDTMAALLRIVNVSKNLYVYGSYMTVSFENPHYVPLLRHEFETIDIDLRDDTGFKIPFQFGTSCVKLHFRRSS